MSQLRLISNSSKRALIDTNDFLNSLSIKQWLPFFSACIFLGWNGIQIVFSLNLILSFINTNSMTYLIINSINYNSKAIPVYIFSVLSFILFYWILHCFFEVGLDFYLRGQVKTDLRKRLKREIVAVSLNFLTPSLLILLFLVVTMTSALLFYVFSIVAGSGFEVIFIDGFETVAFRFVIVAIFFTIVILTWLTDNVLPEMTKGFSFKTALLRGYVYNCRYKFQFFCFYLIKSVLVVITIFAFQYILRHLFLPYFVMLEANYSISLLVFSSYILNFEELMINVGVIFLMFLTSLVIFTPIMAPFYLFQRFLLQRIKNLSE